MCSLEPNNYVEINCPPTDINGKLSRYLCIRGFDFSNVPNDAVITGITMTITRKAYTYSDMTYVEDKSIKLAKNCYYPTTPINTSDEKAISSDPFYIWSTDLISVTYGGNSDPWWTTPIYGSDIRDQFFGAVINVTLVNSGINNMILPQIKCINLSVNYTYSATTYTADSVVYFDNNYKFDTSLSNFAKIDELIYSKVNEVSDILLNSPDIYHIYPCIDEFGYEYSDRFIFKSTWDKEFFTRTETTLKNDSGNI
jgi:hypothetical protein